jgi:hypothetical protein
MYRYNFYYLAGIFSILLIVSGFSLINQGAGKGLPLGPPQDHETYPELWKQVDSLISIGLPQSALEMTETIYKKAGESDNHPQFIKATLYKIRLSSEFEEDFFEKSVEDLRAEIQEARPPARQVLHSILAEVYWRYYQMNRGVFFDRTAIAGFEREDIRTWDLNTLMDVIIEHYFASLEEPETLKSTTLEAYNAVLDTAAGSKRFRPTLYDLLANRAVDFFMNDESSIIQPAYRFEMENPDDFSGAAEFIEISYQTRDTLSLKFHALIIFQELLSFHLNDSDPAALADVNLKRLGFVQRHSIHPQKDSLYLQALMGFENEIMEFPASAEVSFAIASELNRKGAGYAPMVSENYRWEAKKAKEKCESAIERFPGSAGAIKCKILLQAITKSNYRITTEKENVPETPLLALLSYKNLENLHFRLVKLDYKEHREMLRELRHRQELLEKYVSMTPDKTWLQSVPDPGDYQEHSTEIKLPAMPAGYYVLLSSESDAFVPDSNSVSYQTFWVSNISFISQGLPKGGYGVYLLGRESGGALSNVEARLYYREYDYTKRSYEYTDGGRFVSDERGYFEIPPLPDQEKPNSFFLEFNHGSDQLITDDRFYHMPYTPKKDKKQLNAYLFTDRAIYRPGQMVYFKGIVIEKSKDNRTVKQGLQLDVEFMDVNHQKTAEMSLATNDYGSFQGSFVIPRGVLNGQMTIKTRYGSRSIRVEEYKRPNFEIVFSPVEGSYKLGQQVNLSGTAKAFAGNIVSAATVRYRVVRETYYPWRFGYYGYFPMRSSMEISNGTTATDEEGNFNIEFEAIPDHSIPTTFKPAFRYTVFADVTDINNETQSGSTHVSVGSTALQIELGLGEVENKEVLASIPLRTTNLNGQPLPATGNIKISLLKEPDRLLREQLWNHPDVFVMEQEDFIRDFPYDSYRNENEPKSLEVKSVVFESTFDTRTDSAIILDNVRKWQPGRYRVEISSKDEFGTDVEIMNYFILFSPEDKKPPVNEMNWFHVLQNKCEPGENVRFVIGTNESDVRILYEVVHKESVVNSEWMQLSNEQSMLEIPVKEEYRGGFRVNLIFVKHNRIFTNNFAVDVPFTNKKLDVEFITFRDQLLPGQEEEWSLRIRGKNGEKVVAELLTGMYDQSLDQFIAHDWVFNVFSKPYHGGLWNTNNAFHNTTVSRFFMQPVPHIPPVIQGYDQLNWFGFGFYGRNYMFTGRPGDRYASPEAMPGKARDAIAATSLEEEGLGDDLMETGQEPAEEDPGTALDSLPERGASPPQLRRDFRETAFFFPLLKTDANGDIILRFAMPESLTRWKLMGLAHTTDLKIGQFSREVLTQKELMVVSNPPRFFRQHDQFDFSAKLVNVSSGTLNGKVRISFFDASTMQEITAEVMAGTEVEQEFAMGSGESNQVSWAITTGLVRGSLPSSSAAILIMPRVPRR